MIRRSITRILCLASTLFLANVVCLGQSNYAGVNGTVFDPRQQVIPGASLRLTSLSTEATRHVVSNEQGMYQITGLLPGDYKLAAEASGFALRTHT